MEINFLWAESRVKGNMSYLTIFCFLGYLLLASVVQWDYSRVKFSRACWNNFVGPTFYAVMFPLYHLIKVSIRFRDWVKFTYQKYKNRNIGY